MLHTVLAAFDQHQGPQNLQTLSRELTIDADALEGMLDFWVRKGRLRKIDPAQPNCHSCASLCGRDNACPLLVAPPVAYVKP